MAYMKSEVEVDARARILADVNREIYTEFRDNCRKRGIPINILFEAFMKQCIEDQIEIPLISTKTNDPMRVGTTIPKDISDSFKAKCKEIRIPIRIMLESFMYQYNRGEFELVLRRVNNKE